MTNAQRRWKVVAWTAVFLAAAKALWLATRYPQGSEELTLSVQRTIERHQLKYFGDLTSRQFHRPDCPAVATIPTRFRVLFLSRRAALEMGFSPCAQCLP
ncbi:MAG: hypothetical protein PVTTEEND_000256 [Candidatus Fervidibacter sp.]